MERTRLTLFALALIVPVLLMVGLATAVGAQIPSQRLPTAVSQWAEQTQFSASDASFGESFGYVVAVNGDTAVIGAYGQNSAQGAVYILAYNGTAWIEQAKLTASDGVANDNFGISVAIHEDTVIVGAYNQNNFQGAAYIFTRNGTAWTEQAKLTASDGAINERFGGAVAIVGNTGVVGAFNHAQGRGAAYLFTRNGSTWAEQTKLTSNNNLSASQFGVSVALDTHATTLAVGAWLANTGQGEVYVFTQHGTAWAEQAVLTASDGQAADQLGSALAIHNDTIVVGSWVINERQGAAYIFTRTGTTWTEQAKLTASDGVESDHFGTAVAISGNTVMVGAAGRNNLQGAERHGSNSKHWWPVTVSNWTVLVMRSPSQATPPLLALLRKTQEPCICLTRPILFICRWWYANQQMLDLKGF